MKISRKHPPPAAGDAGRLQDVLSRQHGEERRGALRALLMSPLMTATHPAFGAVRRHAHELRDWFAQTAGWILQVDRECARLYKRPADLRDPSRGAPEFGRGRYVLFCLACATLERAEPQTTLRTLGAKRPGWSPSIVPRAWHWSTRTANSPTSTCRPSVPCRTLHFSWRRT